MKFSEINSYIEIFEQFNFNIPEYYTDIPDEVIFTPRELAEYFEMSLKNARRWFNPGLKHGALVSEHLTHFAVKGSDLKEWMWLKDYKKFIKNKNFYRAMEMIDSKTIT
ncbi:hypothetical protein HQN89_02300 [Paenibacillus frigoriresistens]|uniref:hypothetical protein n=1 Tax=Paenibacillus alginolyticus TaxID=59839 RepID=UPI00156747A0|nr:hypothetical protein [Paenibacillus frigoriresistens]NRF89871.1 hypothetical protein [Paenibacillus frigoriresistens]